MTTNKLADRLGAALLRASDLDALEELYVLNATARTAPELQQAIRAMIDPERTRREEGEEFVEITMPNFREWPPAAWLRAGVVVIAAAETAAMTGDPATSDFAFGLLQFWLVEIAGQVSEACGYA